MIDAKSVVIRGLVFIALCGVVLGQRSEPLYQAQKKLIDLGYSPGSPDGLLGARTEAAIKNFQRDNKLPVTGSLDGTTLQKLSGSATGKVSAVPAPPAKLPETFVEAIGALIQRKVETRAQLSMRQLTDSRSPGGSSKSLWIILLERPTDQATHLSILPFPARSTSWKASVVPTYQPGSTVVRSATNSEGVLAFERFDDLTYLLGVGSEVRFDPEQWVEFYGERFRNGGIRITPDKVEFIEGTEWFSDMQVLSFVKDSWARTDAPPSLAALKPMAADGLTAEAFQARPSPAPLKSPEGGCVSGPVGQICVAPEGQPFTLPTGVIH